MSKRAPYPSDRQDQYMLRFPDGMRDQLKVAAEQNGRSMNAEIIARLSGGQPNLRDQFAANIAIDADDLCRRSAEALMGAPAPNPPATQEGWIAAMQWSAEAEARLRYLKADAMLKAREATNA